MAFVWFSKMTRLIISLPMSAWEQCELQYPYILCSIRCHWLMVSLCSALPLLSGLPHVPTPSMSNKEWCSAPLPVGPAMPTQVEMGIAWLPPLGLALPASPLPASLRSLRNQCNCKRTVLTLRSKWRWNYDPFPGLFFLYHSLTYKYTICKLRI